MRKLFLRFLLVYLFLIPALFTFGQEAPPLPFSGTNHNIVNEFTSSDITEQYLNTTAYSNKGFENSAVNGNIEYTAAKGFDQNTATVLFYEDFNPALYGVTPVGWTAVGDACTNWRAFNELYAGGERPEGSFYKDPPFIGYSKMLCDSVINTTEYKSVALSFKTFMLYKNGGFTSRIETTSDGGTTWNTAWEKSGNSDFGPDSLLIVIDNDDVGSDNFQFAFSFEGNSNNVVEWRFDDILLTEGPPVVSDIVFNIIDEDSAAVENARVYIEGYPAVSTDADGYAKYNNLVPGTYYYNITAKDLEVINDSIVLGASDITIDTTMVTPIYIYYEDFTEEPNGWTKHAIYPDAVSWSNGAMSFYRGFQSFTSITYVTPEIKLYRDSTLTVEVGKSDQLNGFFEVGYFSDPSDTLSFIPITSYKLEAGYRYFTYTFPDSMKTSNLKHLGFKHKGQRSSYLFFNTMYLTPRAKYTPHIASFIVKDADGNLIEGADVSVQANGMQTTDSLGQASFISIFAGEYDWTVFAGLDYGRESGTIAIEENDTLVNVELKKPSYYFYEDFKATFPDSWTYKATGSDNGSWTKGQLFHYRTEAEEYPIMSITPQTNLSEVKSVTALVGGCKASGTEIIFGTVSNPNDVSSFTELTRFTTTLSYQFLTVNISEYTGSDQYFAFKHSGTTYSFYYIDLVYMEAKVDVAKYPLTFNVKDEAGQVCEGAEVAIPGYGKVLTDNSGQAIIDVYSKNLLWRINADNMFQRQSTVTVHNSATTVNATLKTKGDFFFIQEFGGGIPFNWTTIVTSGDYIEYWNGEVSFYNYLDSDDPLMLVSSEIDLSKADALTVEIGREIAQHGGIIFGSLTDPKDPTTFQELGTVESEYDYDFYSIDVSDIDIQGSYLGLKYKGNYGGFMTLRTVYVEGRGFTEYCMDSTLTKDGYISRVKLDDINNGSDWQPEVGDYTEISTRIEPGQSDFITVTNGNPNASDTVIVWLDWNKNHEFDMAGNEEFILVNDGTGTTFTGEIIVPEGLAYGHYRMRVALGSGAAPTSCGGTNIGETEDYIIRVTNERHPAVGLVFEDNFDDYVVDDYVAYQNPDEWNTSNNNPGGGKDVLVSDNQAYSGANSANVLAGDNIIKDLNKYFDLGVHIVSTKVFVPTGGDAYYAILSAYKPVAVQAFEATFNTDGTGSVNAGGANTATFEYTLDTWMESKVVIDLDYDSAEFFIDDVSIIKWQWSAGAAGNGIEKQLGALNFAGATDLSNYYIDDVMIETSAICPPAGFSAELIDGNNATMNWAAPRGEGYLRYDNGKNETNINAYGNPFYAACRWTPDQLEPYDGNYITSLNIYVNSQADLVLKVWLGENCDVEIVSQEIESVEVGKFNEFILETPIQIGLLDDIWIGYLCSNYGSGYPVGLDKGPVKSGYGDLFSWDGKEWQILSNSNWDSNWNLAATVSSTADGKSLAKPLTSNTGNSNIVSELTGDYPAPLLIDADVIKTRVAKSNAKAHESFLGYNIYRNGELIVDSLSETNYIDTSLAFGVYSYNVKALYNDGLSVSAHPGSIDILIGDLVPRELVILEIGTGTWCVNCPAAARGAEDLVQNGHKVGVIEYHSGDDYETTESKARLDYYATGGYPTAYFDGVIEEGGGSFGGNRYEDYLQLYDYRITVKTSFEMESYYYNTNANNYIVDIDAKLIGVYPDQENLKVFAVLTESHIEEEWQGLEVLDFVCRDIIPNANGSAADFTNDSIQSYQLEFSIPNEYEFDNLELVVFLQDLNSREILVSTMAELGEAPFGIPANLTGPASAIINTDIALTWDAVDAGNNTLTGYNVFRQLTDEEFTLLGNTTETSYTDNISESGAANYKVTAVYNEGESDPSNTLTVAITTSIEESIFNNTVLYPNPATQVVNITSDYLMESVVVYNYVGKEVFMESVNNTSYRINTSDFDAGIYLFQIETQMGRIAKQIIIE